MISRPNNGRYMLKPLDLSSLQACDINWAFQSHLNWLISCSSRCHRYCEIMSALANNFKTKFAGLLRGMLRRVDGSEVAEPQSARPVSAAAPPPTAAAPAMAPSQPIPAFAPAPSSPAPAHVASVSELEMPLLPILEKLPPDLRSKWTMGGVNLAEANICIAVDKVLPQLAQGTVKITFGELRSAAPNLFRMGEEYDSLPIVLPLNDVLARLSPAMLVRNSPQRTIAPPSEISGPFGAGVQGVAFTTAPLKPTPPTTHFFKKAPPQSEPAKIQMPTPVAPPPPFSQRAAAPVPSAPSAPIPLRANTPPPVAQIPVPARAPMPAPVPAPAPAMPRAPVPPPPAPIPFIKPPTPTMAAPPAASIPAMTSAAPGEIATISVPLRALAEAWPETLRQEIVQMNLINSQVALPVHLVEPALRRGRVIFSWHNLRSWIRPMPPALPSMITSELELPFSKSLLSSLFKPRQNGTGKPNVLKRRHTWPSFSSQFVLRLPATTTSKELAAPLNVPDLVSPQNRRMPKQPKRIISFGTTETKRLSHR